MKLIMILSLSLVAASAAAEDVVVKIENMMFSPAAVKVDKGSRVRWVNRDLVPHTVTSLDGKFDSKNIAPGAEWTFSVKKTGSFDYKCNYHPMMKGALTVK